MNVIKSLKEQGKCDFGFQACEWCAEAKVNTVTKCDVPVGCASNVEVVGIGKFCFVSVSRANPGVYHLTGSYFLISNGDIGRYQAEHIVPTDKLSVDRTSGTSNILLMRVGEREQGVIGLRQTGIADEHLPGLSVHFMGIDTKAIASYLITSYFSVAVLVEDALSVLENVEVSHYYDYK